ncbi:VOC family protein [Exiguobacterium sp. s131]|uniref:VOC family protein n=1 Tax=Exiguobacterium sp. s131 TaxID=2751278 RepID=UPI001BEA8106|nr:VOC family protein [Exiguobacterium sp. s131]
MITGIHHVQLTIPTEAEQEAKAFYCDFLGLREIEKPDSLKGRGGFWLQVGDRSVHVGAEDDVERQKTKAHIAYAVTDLAHWKEALQENEISYSEGIPIPGFERFEFRDPFGNRVEMIQAL